MSTLLMGLALPTGEVMGQANPAADTTRQISPSRIEPSEPVLALPMATRTLSGTVRTQADSLPLEGVAVTVVGRERVYLTDQGGQFTLNILEGDSMLALSRTGYITILTRIPVADEAEALTLYLAVEQTRYETGFGSVVAAAHPYAIDGTDALAVQELPFMSFEQGLQGRLAGVEVLSSGGQPTAASHVRIRGVGSLFAGSEPLYVIDGMPVITGVEGDGAGTIGRAYGYESSPLSYINPGDIARVDVLKDAAALARYGARGGNGVILVTTRTGQPGRTRFHVNYREGVQWTLGTHRDPNAGSEAWRSLTDSALARSSRHPSVSPSPLPVPSVGTVLPLASLALDSLGGTRQINHAAELLRPGRWRKADLSIGSGNDRLTFYTGISYTGQQGVVRGADANRVTLRFNALNQASRNLQLGIRTQLGVATEYVMPAGFDESAGYGAARRRALPFYPTLKPDLAGGPLLPFPEIPFFNSLDGSNTYATSQRDIYFNERRTFRNLGTLFGDLTLAPSLVAHADVGFDYHGNVDREYRNRFIRLGQNITPTGDTIDLPLTRAADYRQALLSFHLNGYLTWRTPIAEDHTIELQAGGSSYYHEGKFNGVQTEFFPNDFSPLPSNGARAAGRPFGNETAFDIMGFFGRAQYQYLNQATLEGTIRLDRSSRFGSEVGLVSSYAVALAWQPTLDLLPAGVGEGLNLRASFGQTANSLMGNFSSRGYWQGGQPYNLQAFQGQRPFVMPNPALGPERRQVLNLGIDYALPGGRMHVVLDAYQRTTRQLLQTFLLPPSAGWDQESMIINSGQIRQRGLEAAIDYALLNTGPVRWQVGFRSATVMGRMTDQGDRRDGAGAPSPFFRDDRGYPVGAYFLPTWAGIAAEDDPAGRFVRGDELVVGLDGQPVRPRSVAHLDSLRQWQGRRNGRPVFTLGLEQRVRFGGFDVSLLLVAATGRQVLNLDQHERSYVRDGATNLSAELTRPGAPNLYASQQLGDRPLYLDPLAQVPTSRFLERADYLRVRSLEIGYTIPDRRIGIVRFYVQGTNLLTLTGYSGADPEFAPFMTRPQDRNQATGISAYALPQVRTMLAGVQVTF